MATKPKRTQREADVANAGEEPNKPTQEAEQARKRRNEQQDTEVNKNGIAAGNPRAGNVAPEE